MRRLTSTILLLVVLAGLVGYIYFVDAERPPSGTPEALPKAFDVSAENIEELQIKNAAGDTSRVQRVDDSWRLIEPEPVEADAAVVESVTSGLASLEIQRVVDDNAGDLAQYGLSPPRIDVAFRLKDEKEPRRLLIGEKTPTGGDLYAKKPDENRVFLIASHLDSTFNKAPFDLRDRDVLKFAREKVEGLELTRGSTAIHLSRSDPVTWRIVKPVTARADYTVAEGLLAQLGSAQMESIVASDASKLAQYGLERPSQTVSAVSGSSRATLLLGAPADGGLYAKDASRPLVFTVGETLVKDLQKEIFDFRQKDMFDARSFSATRLELRRGEETLVLEKSGGDGEDKEVWRSAAGQDVDTAKVQEVLSKLASLRAQSFETAEHAALRTPVLTADVRFDENKTETVTFARANGDVVAKRADETGTAKIDAALFDELLKALDALKS